MGAILLTNKNTPTLVSFSKGPSINLEKMSLNLSANRTIYFRAYVIKKKLTLGVNNPQVTIIGQIVYAVSLFLGSQMCLE